jgi:bacterioferritin-associated ferredoxin
MFISPGRQAIIKGSTGRAPHYTNRSYSDDTPRLPRHVQFDDTICYCFHVPKRKILNFIRIHKPRRASQISECGGAGTGCGWCVPFLKRYFEEAQTGKVVSPDAVTPEEYARLRADYIRDGKGTPPPGAVPLPDANSPGAP